MEHCNLEFYKMAVFVINCKFTAMHYKYHYRQDTCTVKLIEMLAICLFCVYFTGRYSGESMAVNVTFGRLFKQKSCSRFKMDQITMTRVWYPTNIDFS